MGFDPAQFQKKDTVESSLSELEKQSTDLIAYFDSFFSTNFDKDTTIIREDGVVEVLSSQKINTLDNPEGTNYYFQSSAERLQQIGEDIKTELSTVTFDTTEIGNKIESLLEETIRDQVGSPAGDLNAVLNKNSEKYDYMVNEPYIMESGNLNQFFDNARTDLVDYVLNPGISGGSNISVEIDITAIKRIIDDGDQYVNAYDRNGDGAFTLGGVDANGDGDYNDPGDLAPEYAPTTSYYINGTKLDTFSRNANGYLTYNDPQWTGAGTLDYSDPENFALAMFSMFTNGVTNNTSLVDINGDGNFTQDELVNGTNLDTMNDAVEALDKKVEDYIEMHKLWYDTIPRSGTPDGDAGLYPPAFQLFYMNGAGEVDESKGLLGAFSLADNTVTSLAELISFSPDTPDIVTIENILNNWDTATTAEKLPIMKFFAHSELYSAVQGGMNADSGINHPNPILQQFTSDNRKTNPFVDFIATGSYAEDNYVEEKFPLLQDFLAWERDGTVIQDDEGFQFTGTQDLGKAFAPATIPNQFQQILDLYLQHVEKNVPRYVEDNRTLIDLFASDSILPGQDLADVEKSLYQDINQKSFDTISATQNNLNRGISKVKDPALMDILNQTLIRRQEYPTYTESDKISVIHGFNPVQNDFVAGFPTMDIRDFDMFFKTLLNETILTLNPLLIAQGQDTKDTLDDIGPGDTIANLYGGVSTANDFIDISNEQNLAKVLDRYEKLRKIVNNIEKPVNSLRNDDPIVTRPNTYGALTNLNNPSPGLIKEMLDGGYVGAAGTTLPGDHLDQLDYIVDVFASQVEFGQPKSYANIYGSQVLESGNINARQFTKKLAEPRTDGSVPEDTSVPAPLLYASSTSLVIGVIGKELIKRVDEMNVSNNIPSLSRGGGGNLVVSGGSVEAKQYLNNLLDIVNSSTLEVSIDSSAIETQVVNILNDFTSNDDSPYNTVKLSYFDPAILMELKDLRDYLNDAPDGDLVPGKQILEKLETIFNPSSDPDGVIADFVSRGYIGTNFLNNSVNTDTKNTILELINSQTITITNPNTNLAEVYDYAQLRTDYDGNTYAVNTKLKKGELLDIRDFIQGYYQEDINGNISGFWSEFETGGHAVDMYDEFYKILYNKTEVPLGANKDNDPLKLSYANDLAIINSIISKTGADSGSTDELANLNVIFTTEETDLLERFANGDTVHYLDGNDPDMRIDTFNARIQDAINDLNDSNYDADPKVESATFGDTITSNAERGNLIAMFEAMQNKELNEDNLKNNYPAPNAPPLNMKNIDVDISSSSAGFTMADYEASLAIDRGEIPDPVTDITATMDNNEANRKNYLRKTQHFQELFILLSGGISTTGERYGISIGSESDYVAADDSNVVTNANNSLAEKLLEVKASPDDEQNIKDAFERNLNLDETINALQASFDSQLTQRKNSASSDRIATDHFMKQTDNQTASDSFVDDMAKLFSQRMVKPTVPLDTGLPNNAKDGTYQYIGYAENYKFLGAGTGEGYIDINADFPTLTIPPLPNFADVSDAKNFLLALSDLRDDMYRSANTDSKKETLEKFEKWLGHNSASRMMIGSLKDESGVQSDLNILDSMLQYKDKYIKRYNPSPVNDTTIFNNYRDEMRTSLAEVSNQEDNLQNLALDIESFATVLEAKPVQADMLEFKFSELIMATSASPISGGAYRIAGEIEANLRVAEDAILPQLQAAELANDTSKIEYYNVLLGHLLENKPLPDETALHELIIAAGANSVIKPEDLVMTRAAFEALGDPIVIATGTQSDPTLRKQFTPPMAEPYRTQTDIAKVLMDQLLDPANDILNNPDKINTETLYKSMIAGVLNGGGVNATALNALTNAAAAEMGGHSQIVKPIDLYNSVAAAETDGLYQEGAQNLSDFLTVPSSNTKYLTEEDVPDLEDSYLQNNSLSRAVKNERRRIDNNINPSNSALQDIAEQSESYSPIMALTNIAEDKTTEYKKDSISGKTIQELLLLLFVFQMFERSSWDFNKYVNDPNRYQ